MTAIDSGVGPAMTNAREILQLAALLQDVGRFRAKRGHHKRSYKMLGRMAAPLGWSAEEWEMVASIVNRELINDELFFESNGEIGVVWDRIRSVVPTWRTAFKNPTVFGNLESVCKRFEAWREKRAPGSNAAMRQMMEQSRPKA
jgi:hypothetical protein